jgi:hypothetical protein
MIFMMNGADPKTYLPVTCKTYLHVTCKSYLPVTCKTYLPVTCKTFEKSLLVSKNYWTNASVNSLKQCTVNCWLTVGFWAKVRQWPDVEGIIWQVSHWRGQSYWRRQNSQNFRHSKVSYKSVTSFYAAMTSSHTWRRLRRDRHLVDDYLVVLRLIQTALVDAEFKHMGNVFRTHTARVDFRRVQVRWRASTRVVCTAGNGVLARRWRASTRVDAQSEWAFN